MPSDGVLGVTAEGSVRSSIKVDVSALRARASAGAKFSVFVMTSPAQPYDAAKAEKSGLTIVVPEGRPGYSRCWCMRIVP